MRFLDETADQNATYTDHCGLGWEAAADDCDADAWAACD